RAELLGRHGSLLPLRQAFELLDALPGLQGDDGLLAVRAMAGEAPEALELATDVDEVDLGDVDLEHRLDGFLDLRAVRVRVDEEGVLAIGDGGDGLLAQHGGQDDVVRVHSPFSPASNRAASATTRSDRKMSYAFKPLAASTSTHGRLRA